MGLIIHTKIQYGLHVLSEDGGGVSTEVVVSVVVILIILMALLIIGFLYQRRIR